MSNEKTGTSEPVTYICERCKKTFEREWTIADQEQECIANFGYLPPPEERMVICDLCYQEFMAWWNDLNRRAQSAHEAASESEMN